MNYEKKYYAEDAILGSILAENHLMGDLLLKEDYFSGENRMLYKAMCVLYENNVPIDFVTLVTKTNPQDFGGASRIQHIEKLANPKKVDAHLKVVEDAYKEREKEKVLTLALEEKWSLGAITEALSNIDNQKVDDMFSVKELAIKHYNDPWEDVVKEKTVPTITRKLTEITGGWKKGNLIIGAARPSVGKSDWMLGNAIVAGHAGYIPIVFSMEMTAEEEMLDRIIANIGMYDRYAMQDKKNRLTDKQKDKWAYVMDQVAKTNIVIFEKARQSVEEIRAKSRKIKNENPGKEIVIFIDYLTLIKPDDKFGFINHNAVSDITKSLKGMAKEFDCPVVCLAQLSRKVEERQDKRPMMSDLRESGSIEEDANIVVLLYRDSYYNPQPQYDPTFEMNVAKNRGGAVGVVMGNYNKFTGAILDMELKM